MATARRVPIRHMAREGDASIATLLVDRRFVGFGAATKEVRVGIPIRDEIRH